MAAPNLARLRDQIAKLQRERAALDATGPSRAEHEEALRAYAAQAAAAGQARAAYAVATGEPVGALTVRALPNGTIDMAQLLGMLLGADRLAEALIGYLPDDDGALDAEARAMRLGEVDAKLLQLGHAEEDAIEAAETRGEPVQRRADADPAVVLRVRAPA